MEHKTAHWLTPSRCAEAELSEGALTTLRGATATADPGAVRSALRCAWACGRAYWSQLMRELDRAQPDELFAAIDLAMDPTNHH